MVNHWTYLSASPYKWHIVLVSCIYIYTEVYISISFVVRRKYMFLVAAHFNLYQGQVSPRVVYGHY